MHRIDITCPETAAAAVERSAYVTRRGTRFSVWCLSLLVVGTILVTSGRVSATTMIARSLKETVEISEAVMRGRITAKQNELAADGSPWTLYTLSVEEVLLGTVAEREFRFRCFGGTRGSEGVVIIGIPQYQVGDHIVLFYDADDTRCGVANWFQSAFRVVNGPRGEVLSTASGAAVAAFTADNVTLGEKVTVPRPNSTAELIGARSANAVAPLAAGGVAAAPAAAPAVTDLPAADLATVMGELKSFCQMFGTSAKSVASVTSAPVSINQGPSVAAAVK